MRLTWSAHSEIGLVRRDNQDSGYASEHLLIVADGMGGAARGDLASAVAIRAVEQMDQSVTGEQMLDALAQVAERANDTIADLVYDDHDLDGMGTTLCGAMFDGEQLGVVNIGDSRGYLLRDGELSRLTVDHSWVQSLIDDGRLTPEEALYHPHRNLLLKVLNGQPTNTPDLFLHDAEPGDRLLFCSDGLCGLVDDDTVHHLLENPNRSEALRDLISAAHEAGGVDNITILLGDLGDDAETQTPVVLGAAASVEIPAVEPRARFAGADHQDTADDGPASQPTPVSHVSPTEIEPIAGEPAPPSDAVLDPEDARYQPRARPRRRWLWGTVTVVLVLAVIAAAGALGLQAVRSRYYVGVAADKVAIYRGTPDKIGPFTISELEEQSNTFVSDLPPRFQEEVRHHQYQNQTLGSARTTVVQLGDRAVACKAAREARARATTSPTPSPSPTPAPAPTDTPAPSASATTPTPTPSAIPTPPAAPDEC